MYVKIKNWEEFTCPAAASWVVKYVCSVKGSFANFLRFTQRMLSPSYSIKKMYESMSGNNTWVRWCHLVWNRLSVPKHRFFMWLAMQDRLKTKARLHKLGVGIDNLYLCAICSCAEETSQHLFFECAYRNECKSVILDWLGLHCTRTSLLQVLTWIRRCYKGDFGRKVPYTAIAALTYCIWRARNTTVWRIQVPAVKFTVHNIQADVKCRVQNLLSAKVIKDTCRQRVVLLLVVCLGALPFHLVACDLCNTSCF